MERAMAGAEAAHGPSRAVAPGVRVGRALSGFVIAFLVFDAVIKLIPLTVVLDTYAELGWEPDAGLARCMGGLLLLCTLLYAYPRTAVLGAVLLTGYLGGAIATHLRIGNPLLSHTLFGAYLGLMAWAGLYLRDRDLRYRFPLAAGSPKRQDLPRP